MWKSQVKSVQRCYPRVVPLISPRIILVGTGAGMVFAVLDGLLNANPMARRLYAAYKPIARESVNAPLGLAFDLASGILMAVFFVLVAPALPGPPVAKGLVFGLMAWFFRAAMGVAGQAVMFQIPAQALIYTLLSGLVEMTILGWLYAAALRNR